MIEHIPHHLIDQQVWDHDLSRCDNRLWYAQSWVLNIAAPGWDAMIDPERGAMMPLTHRRKYGFRYLFQPFALQRSGVFQQGTDRLLGEFLKAIPAYFRYIDINVDGRDRPNIKGWSVEERIDQVLDLSANYEELCKAYSTGTKRNLKKAEHIKEHFTDQVAVDRFIDLFTSTTGRKYGNLKRHNRRILHELLQEGLLRNEMRIFGIEQGAELLGAMVMIEWEGRSIMLKSASNKQGKEQRVMFHLFDRYIKEQAGCDRLLDLAGSMTPGVARFNAGFGARTEVYLRLRRNRLPKLIKALKP